MDEALKVRAIVLNQYRQGSGYKDVVGELYHFPARYRKRFLDLPAPFVYYEPRTGGEQVYFGAGFVTEIAEDTEEPKHFYGQVSNYIPFDQPIGYFQGPGGEPWEDSDLMRNSVRPLAPTTFDLLLQQAGVKLTLSDPRGRVERLTDELLEVYPPGKPLKDRALRKVQRILWQYERPNSVSNKVKRDRGSKCQLCGILGFKTKNGRRYCEAHHVFHLSKNPPPDCLHPRYLVILCATCHRRMHYADVSDPVGIEGGWAVTIDGEGHAFLTS